MKTNPFLRESFILLIKAIPTKLLKISFNTGLSILVVITNLFYGPGKVSELLFKPKRSF